VLLKVNGAEHTVACAPMARLLDVLREDLRLTGSKEGCGEGECGACSVLIDGRSVCACLVAVGQMPGHDIRTIEGLAQDDRLQGILDAFLEHGAAQCGICTPGFLVTAAEILESGTRPTRQDLREQLAGNLCRCTGYQKIVDAVAEVVGADE